MAVRTFLWGLFQGFLLLCAVRGAAGATIFQDGFESGTLGPAWTVSSTGAGRAAVSTNYLPASGQWHLVLDDAINDANFSAAEATLQLDLSYKKNVVLSFKATSLGNEPHSPPTGSFTGARSFDGVSISSDGGATWSTVQSLANVGTAWEPFSIPLSGTYGSDFRIRFSEYDNAPAPLDGIAIDGVSVTADDDQRLALELPSPLLEGTGPHTGYVLLAFPMTNTLTVALFTFATNQLVLPARVDIPPGQISAGFDFTVTNDALANLTRTVTISASATDAQATFSPITILDDDAPKMALVLSGQLIEGDLATTNATLFFDRPATVSANVSLTAAPSSEVTLPANVIIPAGQTQAVFTVRAFDDNRIDGSVSVSITASSPGLTPVLAQTTTKDNETRTLSLQLPATVLESATSNGIAKISGTLTNDLEVKLTNGNEMELTVPATVRILAGQTQAVFPITAAENTIRDGTRIVTISVAAETFLGTNATLAVRDNDIASYRFGGMPDVVEVGKPVGISVSAADVEGNAFGGFTGQVSLSVVLPDGTSQVLTPATAVLSGASGWTGNVSLPPLLFAPLRLRASDTNGFSGDSDQFDVERVINLSANDLVRDATRNRLYASVPSASADTNANRVVAIEPWSGQITASAFTAQDPGQQVLTSGGEYLYVVLNASGTVSRISPDTMSVLSTFSLGAALFADDVCAVAGQPDLLLVALRDTSRNHRGVWVYDHGADRPTKVSAGNRIEPSADPTIFFAYNSYDSGFNLWKLLLDASGITIVDMSRGGVFNGYNIDIRSAGNMLFSTRGAEADGAQMRLVRVLPTNGRLRPVCPDPTINRVYFIEQRDDYYSDIYNKLGAYDPATLSLIRRVTLPTPVALPSSFIRWGTNGLAFRTASNIVLITSSRLVPSTLRADLGMNMQALPRSPAVGGTVTYSISVTNRGPTTARNTRLLAVLSGAQAVQRITVTSGIPIVSYSVVTVPVGDIPLGAEATLVIETTCPVAGSLTCSASADSDMTDPNFADNTATQFLSVGFRSSADSTSILRLGANNIVVDPKRKLLWASLSPPTNSVYGPCIVSIDSSNGIISDRLRLNANAANQCMALSLNGRYLYVGLKDVPEVSRIELSSSPATLLSVPLIFGQQQEAGFADDIEPLDGDGTSFLCATYNDSQATVFDELVSRPIRSGINTVDRIERTDIPGAYVGYLRSSSFQTLSKLFLSASGVGMSNSVDYLIGGISEIKSGGSLVLASNGRLVDIDALSLKADFKIAGAPCLDRPNRRAYLVNGSRLMAFDTASLATAGSLALPINVTGDWALSCVRWGLDGFAILGNNGDVCITRWSGAVPPSIDSNADGISDSWEATYFNSLNVDPAGDDDGDGLRNFQEYLFGTSPIQASVNPMQVSAATIAGQPAIRLVFPRRTGLLPQSYEFVVSSDLVQWATAQNVIETVVSTQTLDGILFETIEAIIPVTDPTTSFVRMKWLPR